MPTSIACYNIFFYSVAQFPPYTTTEYFNSLVLSVSVHAANPQLRNNYSTLAHAYGVIRLLAASLSCQYTTEIRVGKKYPLGGMVDGIRGHNGKYPPTTQTCAHRQLCMITS